MITFTQLGKLGRLGNQLFQYAVVRAVSLETGYELKIPNFDGVVWHNQQCLLNKFSIECDFLDHKDYYKIANRYIESDHTLFHKNVFEVSDNTDLYGFFQNYQYFSKYEKEIRADFRLNDSLKEYAEKYISDIKSGNEEIVSLHFRRGDNTDGTSSEYSNYYGREDTLSRDSIFGQYFFKAMENFNDKKYKFLVFSGGTRKGMSHNQSDIDWCKNNLDGDRFVFCEGNSDIQDFAIMKNCDHNLTTHMTSFGWWAAFLNENPNKIVIAPKNYTVPDDGRVKYGFYPNDWKIV
jgi:hypothetical protein